MFCRCGVVLSNGGRPMEVDTPLKAEPACGQTGVRFTMHVKTPRLACRLFALCTVLSVGCGCGHPPAAWRVRGDRGDGGFPRGRIHFVEHGRRAAGVLVTATKGGGYRFYWETNLVPATPVGLEGPIWTDRKLSRAEAIAVTNLPAYRDAERCI